MRYQRFTMTRLARSLRGEPVRAVIFLIELYRHTISPLRLPSCRFMPTCSQYAVEALREYGLIRGTWLAVIRLGKCGPWHAGGWDPIPERAELVLTGRGPCAPAKQGGSEPVV